MASRIGDRREPDQGLMELVASAFQKAKLRGAIIGGVARNYWEVPRLTFDIDFTVVGLDAAGTDLARFEQTPPGIAPPLPTGP